MSSHPASRFREAIAFRRLRPAFVLTALLALSLLARPASATPALVAVDHDINWGGRETHFVQNKQAESPMATNPTDALNSITGANDNVDEPDCQPDPNQGTVCLPSQTANIVGIYTTKDGGGHWRKQMLDFHAAGLVSIADPTVAFGPKPVDEDGREFSYAHGARAYFAAMAQPIGHVGIDTKMLIAVAHSDDGGLTWSRPVVSTDRTDPTTDFNDKPMLWADNNPESPSFGNVYIGWTLFHGAANLFFCTTDCPPGIILFARSTDGGRTWGGSTVLSETSNNNAEGGREAAVIRTDRRGRVVALWLDTVDGKPAMVSRVSHDGGRHFAERVLVGYRSDMNPLPGTSFPDGNYPAMDIDQSTGAIYATWMDYHQTGANDGHGLVTVKRSLDHGASWTSAASIDVPGRTPFHPSLAVARNGTSPEERATPGRIILGVTELKDVPFDAPPVTGITNYVPLVFSSDDGGTTWSAGITPAGATPSDPAAAGGFLNDIGSEFVGDYTGASAAPDGRTFYFSYTSLQTASTCPAVDAYRAGVGPAPFIYTACPSTFGNADIHVAVITPGS